MNPEIPGAPVEVILFAGFAFLAIFGALRVVMASDPFISALSLLFNFVSLGALYLLLEQPFVAVAQILVYAGAVVVLFLFVIAYLGDRRELATEATRAPYMLPAGLVVSGVLAVILVIVSFAATMHEPVEQLARTSAEFVFGSPSAIGEVFMTRYVLAFEVTSFILLVAAIGGVVLGLTGRARVTRLRRVMQTRSSDQQRRDYEERERELRERRTKEGSS